MYLLLGYVVGRGQDWFAAGNATNVLIRILSDVMLVVLGLRAGAGPVQRSQAKVVGAFFVTEILRDTTVARALSTQDEEERIKKVLRSWTKQ